MHVPDGVFPLWLQLLMYGISGIMLYISVKMINKKFDDKIVPYMGVLAAVILPLSLLTFQFHHQVVI